ncbi:hypothetical protein [Flexivirga sp. B27]
MTWIDEYGFTEPLVDMRDHRPRAERLEAELRREVGPGHPLHGRTWSVVADALPNDDVIVRSGSDVGIVHLTWSRGPERLPWPMTTFVSSPEALTTYVENEYCWDS